RGGRDPRQQLLQRGHGLHRAGGIRQAARDHAVVRAASFARAWRVRQRGIRGSPRGQRPESLHLDQVPRPRSRGQQLRQPEHQPWTGCRAVSPVSQLLLHDRGGLLMRALSLTPAAFLSRSRRVMQLRNLALMLCAFAVAACTDVNRPDLNNASVNSFSKITSRAQVAALAVGVLSRDRANNETEITINEIIGRDAYVLTTSEPRFVTQLLGTSVDPSGFLGTALWPYDGIRLANIGIDGIAAVDPSAGVLTGDEINSSQGYLRTMKALLYLRAIESRDTAGIPIAVDVPPTDPPAAIVCKPDALRFIVALLDSAHAELQAGINSPFPFSLPSGFAGFDEPGTFDKFNRALTAKVNVYLAYRDFSTNGSIDQTALSAAALDLDSSFVDTTNAQNLNLGPVYVYTTNTGDATNGLFGDPSSTTTRANPRVLTESDPGDQRVAHDVVSTSTIKVAGVSSDITFDLYPSPTSTTPLMLNKELIL